MQMKTARRGHLVAAGVVLLAAACAWGQNKPASAPAASGAMTVAVLTFDSDLKTPEKAGELMADVLSARLGAMGDVMVLERQDVAKVLSEQKISLSGLVAPDQAVQVGKMIGAKLLVCGRVTTTGTKVYLVCKVIGTETSQVKGFFLSLPQNTSIDDVLDKGGQKLQESLPGWAKELVPAAQQGPDLEADLKKLLDGKAPASVAVVAPEVHVGQRVIDPAVETEFKRLLTHTGVPVTALKAEAAGEVSANIKDFTQLARTLAGTRYLVYGEAFSEAAGTVQGMTIALARVEIQIIDLESGKVLLADRATARAADLAEHLAAKTALQKAARELAAKMLPTLYAQFPAAKSGAEPAKPAAEAGRNP
jgi:TolB-like protein